MVMRKRLKPVFLLGQLITCPKGQGDGFNTQNRKQLHKSLRPLGRGGARNQKTGALALLPTAVGIKECRSKIDDLRNEVGCPAYTGCPACSA